MTACAVIAIEQFCVHRCKDMIQNTRHIRAYNMHAGTCAQPAWQKSSMSMTSALPMMSTLLPRSMSSSPVISRTSGDFPGDLPDVQTETVWQTCMRQKLRAADRAGSLLERICKQHSSKEICMYMQKVVIHSCSWDAALCVQGAQAYNAVDVQLTAGSWTSVQAQSTPVLRRLDLRSGLGSSSSDITMTSSRSPMPLTDCSHLLLLSLGQVNSVLSLSCLVGI